MNGTWNQLRQAATDFLLRDPGNRVRAEDAMRPDLVGMSIFEAPVFAVGAARDPLFSALRKPEAVHPDCMLPTDWLPGARSVVSFFAPFTERVKGANRKDMSMPADEWQHARIEGEEMLQRLRLFVRDFFAKRGYAAVAPLHDERYGMLAPFAAKWSERHAGYVCGLGTFGLSKGLITERGMAGRLGSVVTECPLPVTERKYSDIYAYCAQCGACAGNCPVQCIDLSREPNAAKAHQPCSDYLDAMRAAPPRGESAKARYGCGKCQVAVPCESGIPQNCE